MCDSNMEKFAFGDGPSTSNIVPGSDSDTSSHGDVVLADNSLSSTSHPPSDTTPFSSRYLNPRGKVPFRGLLRAAVCEALLPPLDCICQVLELWVPMACAPGGAVELPGGGLAWIFNAQYSYGGHDLYFIEKQIGDVQFKIIHAAENINGIGDRAERVTCQATLLGAGKAVLCEGGYRTEGTVCRQEVPWKDGPTRCIVLPMLQVNSMAVTHSFPVPTEGSAAPQRMTLAEVEEILLGKLSFSLREFLKVCPDLVRGVGYGHKDDCLELAANLALEWLQDGVVGGRVHMHPSYVELRSKVPKRPRPRIYS